MLKKLLIALALLTASANASFFEALKDAAEKAIEEQNRLNNAGDGNSPVTSDEAITPQFNSLAEEAAYKKRQEEEKISDSKRNDHELKNTIVPRIQRLRVSEENFYQKYLVKQDDTQDIIDDKFKNRSQLYNAMQKDFAVLDTEREKLYNVIENSHFNGLQHYFKDEMPWYGELSSIFTYAKEANPDRYVLECYNKGSAENQYRDEMMVEDLRRKRDNFENVNKYEIYLKCAYLTFQQRVNERAQKIKGMQVQKEQQVKLANEQKERKKVQAACQAWRTKANKQVYSLGIGDRVAGKGTTYYVIQGVNANTFLVNTFGGTGYLKKSDSVPYDSLKTAPSEYCYR